VGSVSAEVQLGERSVHARCVLVAQHGEVDAVVGQIGQQRLIARIVARVDAGLATVEPAQEVP
jgi:hypothetical protein